MNVQLYSQRPVLGRADPRTLVWQLTLPHIKLKEVNCQFYPQKQLVLIPVLGNISLQVMHWTGPGV